MNKKITNLIRDLKDKDKLKYISGSILILQIVFLITLLLFERRVFLLFGILFVTQLVLYGAGKPSIMRWIIANANVYVSLNYLLNSMIFVPLLDVSIQNNLPTSFISILQISVAIMLIAALLIFGSKQKEIMQGIKDYEFTRTSKEKETNGDLPLGSDIDTRKKVTVPKDDRYLHFQIIGPTGSGKTSQTIIPAVYNDIENHEIGTCVIDPKGDLAQLVYSMAQYYNRQTIYFDPTMPNCPTFNPLYGNEQRVIEDIVTTINMLDGDGSSGNSYFKTMKEQLVRNSVRLVKRLRRYEKKEATFLDVNDLISNGGKSKALVGKFKTLNNSISDEFEKRENQEVIEYFEEQYFPDGSEAYKHNTELRAKIYNMISNRDLRKILCSDNGKSELDFRAHVDREYEDGKGERSIICINTATGELGDLGKFLGYFLILNYQSAIFKRKGDEDSRMPCVLVVDECQNYVNSGMATLLQMGRSYRISCMLATQSVGQIATKAGNDFMETFLTNCRNKIIYPGLSAKDAEYYSSQFGEVEREYTSKSKSRQAFSITSKGTSTPTESISVHKQKEAKYSHGDIIYQEFGHVFAAIVRNKTVQPATIVQIEYIPQELNITLKQMMKENLILMRAGLNPDNFSRENNELQNKVKEVLNQIDEDDII